MKIQTAILLALFASLGRAQQTEAPSYYQAAAKVIGKAGTMNADGSYRINLPRTDVQFTNEKGMPIPPDLGLATYAAFIGSEENSLVVGDVAMLRHEINGVIDALRAGGIEVVALHNHMSAESPRLFFLHYQGHGKVADLAKTLKTTFAVLKTQAGAISPVAKPGKPKLDTAELQTILGVKATVFPSGVQRFASPRKDLKVTIDDLAFTPGMGLASWAAFSACECGLTMVMGDTCCANRTELQASIDAYRKAGISITSIHNHTFGGSPDVIFMHFEAEGDSTQIAKGIRSCWDGLGKK